MQMMQSVLPALLVVWAVDGKYLFLSNHTTNVEKIQKAVSILLEASERHERLFQTCPSIRGLAESSRLWTSVKTGCINHGLIHIVWSYNLLKLLNCCCYYTTKQQETLAEEHTSLRCSSKKTSTAVSLIRDMWHARREVHPVHVGSTVAKSPVHTVG